MNNIAGKKAIITGATSGVGLELSLLLLKEKVNLILLGRDFTNLKKAISQSKINDYKVSFFSVDFTVDSELENLVNALSAENEINMLIHCAGTIRLGAVENSSIEDLEVQYKVNVLAPFYITKNILPSLKVTQGQIIFLNSVAGLISKDIDNTTLYASSKHAKKAIAKGIRNEVKSDKIRVTDIFLGSTATPMQEKIQKLKGNTYKPNRFMIAKEVAEVIVSVLKTPKNMMISDLTLIPI